MFTTDRSRRDFLAGGGALFDTGACPIRAACYLSGEEPTSVSGVASTVRRDLYPDGVEETMTYTLAFPSGFAAMCRASYGVSEQQCLTAGPNGFVDVVGDGGGKPFNQSGGGRPNRKAIRLKKSRVMKDDTLQLARLHDAFALSILGDHDFRCPGPIGRRDIAICEAVAKSAAEGGRAVTV